jgi:hypothetical protein
VSALRRPVTLGTGDRVRYRGAVHTVIGMAGGLVRLADTGGGVQALPLASLMASPGFALVDVRDRRPLPPLEKVEALPP